MDGLFRKATHRPATVAPTDADQIRGRIDQGFDDLIFNLPSAPADKVLPLLDQYAAIMSEVRA